MRAAEALGKSAGRELAATTTHPEIVERQILITEEGLLPPGGIPKLRWPAHLSGEALAHAAPRSLRQIRAYKNEMWRRLARQGDSKKNTGAMAQAVATQTAPDSICGVGFGVKITEGQVATTECVRVYVVRKLPKAELSRDEMIPESINGLPTDVIEMPDLVAHLLCGSSVGHINITAGTIGCLVQKEGRQFILSNNHVLADCNRGRVGDQIVQPGPVDGGIAPPIATLSDFVPLDFSGAPNIMDVAIAELAPGAAILPQIEMIGSLHPQISAPVAGLPVKKCGRTTELTGGRIEDMHADVKVTYPNGRALFSGVIAVRGSVGPFSRPGDSGSLIVTAEGNMPVALLFAGDESRGLSFGSGITGILGHFGVTHIS